MIRNSVFVVLLGVLVSGCVSTATKPISSADVPKLSGATLAVTKRKQPTFLALSVGKSMLGLTGIAAASASGNKLVAEKGIPDPSQQVAEATGKAYSAAYGLNQVTGVQLVQTGELLDLAKASNGAAYILDITTTGWGYDRKGVSLTQLIVGYGVKLRLLNAQKGTEVSSDFCQYTTDQQGGSSYSQDELLENDAAVLKRVLSEATQFCIAKFKPKLGG